jgi:hypothetical protein
MPTNKQPSFAERVQELKATAHQLTGISKELNFLAEVVGREVIRMEAAEKRFSERRGQKRERRAR